MRILFCLLCFLTSVSFAAVGEKSKDSLYSLLSSFHSLSAQFEQTIYDANHHPIRKSSGTMALSRPGKFRWEVQQPNQQWLIADGNTLWIYDVDLSQATKQVFDPNKTSSPASLLSGSLKNLESRFRITQLNTTQNPSFRLLPKDNSGLFRWIVLNFNNGKLSSLQMLDSLGSLSLFQFQSVQIDPPLKPQLFQFLAPKGVDVVQNQ